MKINDFMIFFENISINGRYIYAYLCLRNSINTLSLNKEIPCLLNSVLVEFVESKRLDLWQEKVDEVMPSYILDKKHNKDAYEFIDYEQIIQIREYYLEQPQIIIDIYENIFWLGVSNLYGGFDTKITMPYLKGIISDLISFKINLPDMNIVKDCSILDHHGWGNRTKMNIYS